MFGKPLACTFACLLASEAHKDCNVHLPLLIFCSSIKPQSRVLSQQELREAALELATLAQKARAAQPHWHFSPLLHRLIQTSEKTVLQTWFSTNYHASRYADKCRTVLDTA